MAAVEQDERIARPLVEIAGVDAGDVDVLGLREIRVLAPAV